MRIEGTCSVVTGGTQGIGFAIAERLIRGGARVAICARNGEAVERAIARLSAHGVVTGTVCDVSREDEVERFTELVHDRLGPAGIVVNNAGLAHTAPVSEMTVEQFDETMAVNVRGVFLVCRAFLADIQASAGHIVNIASLAGRNPVPELAAYAASKHAVLGFSKSLFMEVRHLGVRVTAVCPGSVVTSFREKSGREMDRPDRKLRSEDVADAVMSVLALPDRALVSELDLRPTNP